MVVTVVSGVAIGLCRAESMSPVRVALMDFSTDDNSYRSIQVAADFTSLVQMGLVNEPGIEWIERSKISLAKQEFGLAEMRAAGVASPIRRGRVVGADWLVTGRFSSDDQGRSTLSVQVIELKYADVIASDTIRLPDKGKGWIQLEQYQTTFVVEALQQLFAKARTYQRQAANQAQVALLFLVDTSEHGFRRETDVLPREFSDALEREAAINRQIRLIHFPRAYQSTDESEMIVDGIIESGQDSWSRTADLYVWGTYSVTNARVAERIESRLNVQMHLWDGTSQPAILEDSLKTAASGIFPPEQIRDLINRFIGQTVANARPQRIERDSTMVRRQIADSIAKAYVSMTGRRRSDLGLDDKEGFVQAVHMLETACFFDPDNADARVLWITCRYGWWIDFGFRVKNQFWTKWRRSQAWGKYVDRFGLRPNKVDLPFPYDSRGGVSAIYAGSLQEVVEMFPQWRSTEEMAREDKWRKQGVHTWLKEAESHGFPKEMPHDLALKWRKELETELAQRKGKVADYSMANADNTNAIPGRVLGRSTGAISNQTSPSPKPVSPSASAARASSTNVSRMVPAPEWLKNFMSVFSMFRLYPPNALPHELKPEVLEIQFPPRFEVKVIRQMAYHNNQLWILAMDERSSPSSDPTPDLSAETLDKRSRLWCLEAEGARPNLFKADSLPARVNSFLFQDDQLWLAGDSVGVLDLKGQGFRRYGLAEGLVMKEVQALAAAGGRIHAAGDPFKISSFDLDSSRWENLPLPKAHLSSGTGIPCLLTGNKQWLGYVAGATLFHDMATGSWTNPAQINSVRCFAAEDSAFWIGGGNGLQFFDPAKQSSRGWNSPVFIQSPMISLMGGSHLGDRPSIPQSRLDELDEQIRGRLGKMESDRRRMQAETRNQKRVVDPFHMTSRIPGGVAALANDADFLWVGTDNYFGSYLLLLHKPSLSLVASYSMAVRDRISSLAVSDTYIWVGTSYGDHSLIRLRKDSLFSVPRNRWTSITIESEDRERLIQTMSKRDQAMYAFYRGDDQRVVELLGGIHPDKASLEEMLVLAWSYDVSGIDDPQNAQAWFQHIGSRHPDSPWATYAMASMKANDVAHVTGKANAMALARFDHNGDGKLDEAENRAMLRDEDFAKVRRAANEKQTLFDLEQIILRYDRNGDLKLDRVETGAMCQAITVYLRAERELSGIQRRNRVLDPLMSDKVPSPVEILATYDTNKDSSLDAVELRGLAAKIQKEKR